MENKFIGHFIPWKEWNKQITILNSLIEPKFVELIKDLSITNVYVNRKLRPIFDACEYFVRSEGNFASDYYRYGHMGLTHIHICEQHFFDDDWILFLMGAVNSEYGKVGTSGLISRSL